MLQALLFLCASAAGLYGNRAIVSMLPASALKYVVNIAPVRAHAAQLPGEGGRARGARVVFC